MKQHFKPGGHGAWSKSVLPSGEIEIRMWDQIMEITKLTEEERRHWNDSTRPHWVPLGANDEDIHPLHKNDYFGKLIYDDYDYYSIRGKYVATATFLVMMERGEVYSYERHIYLLDEEDMRKVSRNHRIDEIIELCDDEN
jgi:hypothetical protein